MTAQTHDNMIICLFAQLSLPGSPIHVYALSGDVFRCIRAEVQHRTDDVVRFRESAHGDTAHQLSFDFRIRPDRLTEVGSRHTGSHGIDEHIHGSPFHGHAHGQHFHRSLARVVCAHHGASALRGCAGDIDNPTAPVLHHHFGRGSTQKKRTFDIGVEYLVKAVFSEVQEGSEKAPGCVVHENVDPAERLHGRFHQSGNTITLGYVRNLSQGFCSLGRALPRLLLRSRWWFWQQ